MELEVEKQDKNSVTIIVKGEGVTLLNMLRDELWNDKNVTEAAIIQEHPFTANPKIMLKVSTGSPITTLEKAVDRIKGNLEDFRKAFKKVA